MSFHERSESNACNPKEKGVQQWTKNYLMMMMGEKNAQITAGKLFILIISIRD